MSFFPPNSRATIEDQIYFLKQEIAHHEADIRHLTGRLLEEQGKLSAIESEQRQSDWTQDQALRLQMKREKLQSHPFKTSFP